MAKSKAIFIIFFVLAVFNTAETSEIKDAVAEIKDYSLDSAAVVELHDFVLPLTFGKAEFQSGRLYFYGFLDGQPTAAFFRGRGHFYFYPPDAIERQQAHRFYGEDTIDVRFDQVYFSFASVKRWFDGLLNSAEYKQPRYRIRAYTKRLRKIPEDVFKYNLSLNIVQARLDNHDDFVWIDFVHRRYRHTVYHFDPYDQEQVSIYKYSPEFIRPQWVSSHHDGKTERRRDIERRTDLFRYDFDIKLSTYKKSGISCKMSLAVIVDSLRTVEFSFPRNYRIDRIWGDVADSLAFFKKKGQSGLTIELSRVFHKGDTVTIGLKYRTNLFYHYMNYGVVQQNLTHWYPYQGYRQLSNYNITYTLDKGFSFISVGNLVEDSLNGDKEIYHYVTDHPVAYVSFNYGAFDSFSVEDFDPPITIYTLPKIHNSPIFGNPNLENTAEDIAGSFQFYQEHFAPYRFKKLDVAAMAVGFGQGSPGVVHLPSVTFTRSLPGYDDKLRAHEVAHQWWGHIVNPATYRDVWLSEGLAEYSAALYIEQGKDRPEVFRDILKEWRKEVLQNGKTRGVRSVGYRAGALFLGERLKSELSPADFITLVYSKAAYMLHMLRFEIETVRNNPGGFMELLARFANRNYNQLTFTEDFIELAREYLGDRTDPFFDQWLYDWRIPKIEENHEIRPTGSVNFNLKLKDVNERLELYYPVRFVFRDGTAETDIYKLTPGENRFEFAPPLGKFVDKIEFNPDRDILEK